jgi:electron-transferring-flavoprotein dehydrogenase
MERIDVAVVGGGPAGSSAAWTAAEGGANTVVFEKGVPREDRNGPGPDSTDAAGLLDYWVDLMNFGPGELPEDVVLRDIDGAMFYGPSKALEIESTGMDGSYPSFGLAFDRARFDDWLRAESEHAGASYRVGESVREVETTVDGGHTHTLTLAGGDQFEAEYLILADGPQRTVTTEVLDQFTPPDRQIADVLDPTRTNHIAYQEHRRVPEAVDASSRLRFWWGLMPGHTAYPWLFPNDDGVARIGLTMPIGLDIEAFDAREWALLREDDEKIPSGSVYIERLFEREFPEYGIEDFPIVEDRGKRNGTETYPISSTRPIESPTGAGIAVVGGAMGGTSAFHEGGDHVAVRTGKIAGRLAAAETLGRYNRAWQNALGTEFRRNVTAADVVADYGPDDWDRAFGSAGPLVDSSEYTLSTLLRAGVRGTRLLWQYWRTKRNYIDGGYVQFHESEYAV